MRAVNVLSYSFSAIKLRKFRSALTILGVAIGITAIVALLSVTQGLQATITDDLNQGLSANSLIVMPGSSGQGGDSGFSIGIGSSSDSSGFSLYNNYTSQIVSLSPNITGAVAVMQKFGYVESDSLNRSVTIYGVDYATYAEIYGTFVAESGTIPLNPKNDTVIIGSRVSDPRQNGTRFIVPGDEINLLWLNATSFPTVNENCTVQVSGVLDTVGGFGMGGPSDTGVYIPLSSAESFFGTDACDMIIVTLTNTDKATIDSVSSLIREHFENQVLVISADAVQSVVASIISTIELFLGGIAAISLLVAGVSIMNIMIVSLIERTREIGILKALGMKSRTVLLIFLGEAVIIGLIGSIIGIIGGWVLAHGVSWVLSSGLLTGNSGGFAIKPLLTPTVVFVALIFGIGVTVVFALYPAWSASKLKPVDALRHE
ncbi:MAG: ABC transporter permease [Candidatus Bathyarchaeota archaeon]|nr:ABC transporter permease [Candidatus Termiticorpusculum sp.]